ncbi:LacI family DNA-binding transcriptional regulator [Pedococcus sp. 5OH_020]|uniref:LacI family DNA-binding transcriptional regulator n=1 Tax=Pedococcus sp. 5OH_020 TaxID=2989814 RepID=UPI0022E9DCD3|nr:LacI family DNA-binding transcriptional regulator [Pedococcus sp. 5OH_020]
MAEPTTPARTDPRVTIAEVAAAAGVSPSTVSNVLSGNRGVGLALRARVERAVQELGYRPNHVAQNLRTRRSLMVAVVVPDLTNEYYSVLTRGLADTLEHAGYGTYVCNTDGLSHRETKFLQDAQDRGADGVVMAPLSGTSTALAPVRHDRPFVCVGDYPELHDVDRVVTLEQEGSYAATAHLVSRGAALVAMIRGPERSAPGRLAGFRQALADAGRPFDNALVVDGGWSREGGSRAMQELLDRDPRIDGVFCANDLMALGALASLRARGIRVPGDARLVGFDDIDAASLVSPALTTVTNPAYETGRQAALLLLSRMWGDYEGAARTVVLPCELVLRESS